MELVASIAAAHALTNAVSNIADRTNASLFFTDWLTQRNSKWLPDNTGLEERLNVVYQNDRSNFLTGYLNNIGLGEVNRALEHIPQMSTGLYLNFIWEGVLHGSLNPSYSPPQVNTPDPNNIDKDTLYLAEHHLYGSSRLGIKTYETEPRLRVVFERTAGQTVGSVIENTLTAQTSWFSAGYADWIRKDRTAPFNGSTYNRTVDLLRNVRILGSKQYELTDHLGNVLATVLDKKTEYGNTSGLYNGYYANLASVSDYFPGGMIMPGRNKSYDVYKFGFNGQMKSDEIYGDGNLNTALFWEYDTRLVRRWNLDPVTLPYLSLYSVMENNPIFKKDPLGNTAGDYYDFRTGEKVYNDKKNDGKVYIRETTTETASSNGAVVKKDTHTDKYIGQRSEIPDKTVVFNQQLKQTAAFFIRANYKLAQNASNYDSPLEFIGAKVTVFNRLVTDGSPYDIKNKKSSPLELKE